MAISGEQQTGPGPTPYSSRFKRDRRVSLRSFDQAVEAGHEGSELRLNKARVPQQQHTEPYNSPLEPGPGRSSRILNQAT